MTIITMGEFYYHVQLELIPVSPTRQYSIVLSWDLLACISVEGRIPLSFTSFITTPELSGPLYISPDVYHTQITEYSLQTIYQYVLSSLYQTSYSVRHSPMPDGTGPFPCSSN